MFCGSLGDGGFDDDGDGDGRGDGGGSDGEWEADRVRQGIHCLILGKANQSVQNFDTRILHDLISAILCDSVPTRRSVASAC